MDQILKNSQPSYSRPDEETVRTLLTEEQYWVTQENGTEPPFANLFWDHFEPGLYVDVVTGEPLFSSRDKFPSSCGWPAFSKAVCTLRENRDTGFGMVRKEVRSPVGDSHLGHVFHGEPGVPGGVRYCINSASLRFVPLEKLEVEGYGEFKDQC